MLVQQLRDTEVEDLYELRAAVTRDKHDVRWFEISMDDAPSMGVAKRFTNLCNDGDRTRRLDSNLAAKQLRECPTLQVLHRQEQRAVRHLPVVVDGDDVRILQAGGRASFGGEAGGDTTIARQPRMDHLDDRLTTDRGLICQVDASHPAFTQLGADDVLVENPTAYHAVGCSKAAMHADAGLRLKFDPSKGDAAVRAVPYPDMDRGLALRAVRHLGDGTPITPTPMLGGSPGRERGPRALRTSARRPAPGHARCPLARRRTTFQDACPGSSADGGPAK